MTFLHFQELASQWPWWRGFGAFRNCIKTYIISTIRTSWPPPADRNCSNSTGFRTFLRLRHFVWNPSCPHSLPMIAKCSRSNGFSTVFTKVPILARTSCVCRPPRSPPSEARWADPQKCFRCNGFVTILPKSSKLARTSDISAFPRARFATALVTWNRSVPKLH